MDSSRTLNSAQTKRVVIGVVLALVLLTAGSVWWGLSHPTPKSLQVLTPAQTPGGPATVQATIIVNGMSCEGCAASIKSSLTKMGADSVNVDLATNQAVIVFRTDKMSLTNILEKLVELGYQPKLQS